MIIIERNRPGSMLGSQYINQKARAQFKKKVGQGRMLVSCAAMIFYAAGMMNSEHESLVLISPSPNPEKS